MQPTKQFIHLKQKKHIEIIKQWIFAIIFIIVFTMLCYYQILY